jgi:hypothetical protein
MTIKKKFYIDVYSCTVLIICCDNVKRSVNRYCKKYDPDDKGISYDVVGFFYKPDGAIKEYFIWFDINNIDVNTVNHEKSHLVEEILKDRNIKPSGEIRAYLDGLISEKIAAFFAYQKNNIKFK